MAKSKIGGSGSKSMVLSSFLSSTRSTVGVLMLRVRHLHLTHLQMMMMMPVMMMMMLVLMMMRLVSSSKST